MTDLVGGALGSEAKYDVAFTGGNLVATIAYAGQYAGATVGVTISAKQILEALKAAVPNVIADDIINAIELGLGAV